MKIFYKALCCTILCIITLMAAANDSEYYMHGDQLIPLQQSDISVQKEVLTLTQQPVKDYADPEFLVSVDYNFYNPSEEKTLIVGFEARPPQNYYPEKPTQSTQHPFLKDFSVILNGVELPYQTAVVTDKIRLVDGKIPALSPQQMVKINQQRSNAYETGGDVPDMRYAYYFTAVFKHGNNKLRHQYRFTFGATAGYAYELGYLLTPANRWANQQIDDFTLNIHLLSLDGVLIERSFFDDATHWSSDGQLSATPYADYSRKVMQFNSDGKVLTFHKKDFHPQGELYLYKGLSEMDYTALVPDLGYCFDDLSYYSKSLSEKCKNATVFELKVLRNLPFAKHGYVFRDKAVQKYYEDTQKWYKPNPKYQANMKDFTQEEVNWVKYWKSR